MYIVKKILKNKKTGLVYNYYKLVESVQTDKGPRQRNIMHLGELDLSKIELRTLAMLIERRILGMLEAVPIPKLSELADSFMEKYESKIEITEEKRQFHQSSDYHEIDLNSVKTKENRSFGAEFVVDNIWKRINIDKLLSELKFDAKEISLAKAIIYGRLISPGSERHTYNWFKKRSSLNELLKYDISNSCKDLFYEIGDLLYIHKEQIERRLRKNIKAQYSIKECIYLYDLTNTYFEGAKLQSKLAKRGKSKEKRMDCPLVTLALVVDDKGFPVYSKIYKGNQSESQTFQEIIENVIENYDVETITSLKKYTILMDRGIATTENVNYLKENNLSYFVVERRNAVNLYKEHFENKNDFNIYQTSEKDQVFLKKIAHENGTDLLVYSTGKDRKEQAMVSTREKRLIEDLDRLVESNRKRSIILASKINIRIGRLRERYRGISNFYDIQLNLNKEKPEKVDSIEYNRILKRPKKQEFGGCYVITTDHKELTDKEIWDTYMNLTKVESAFRSLKSQLGTRPIYHKNDSRIEAHLFISVFAYTILRSIEFELQKQHMNLSWDEVRKILSTHQRTTVEFRAKDDYIHRIRLTSEPEECHKEIYKKLNLKFINKKIFDKNKIIL